MQAQPGSATDDHAPAQLQRLLPPGPPIDAQEIVERLGLWHAPEPPAGRPRVLLNMVASADGRASLQGRSAPLSSSADRALFHALRAPVDAVLVGANTVRLERYGPIVGDQERRDLRQARGLAQEPLACIVSASLALDSDIPLLADPGARVAIVTPSDGELPGRTRAQLHYVRAQRQGLLDLPAALAQLREHFGVRTLLCEGGPRLAGELVAAGLLDELFLSLAPMLAGGREHDAATPRILVGVELAPPAALELLEVLHSRSHLFLRYRIAR